MFWGLEMEPAKVYKQSVQKSFHVSMACLQPNKCNDSNYSTLMLKKDNKDFVLCNLHKEKAIQVHLDLMFGSGDEIAFTVTGGKNQVYLSGYILEDDDDDMFDGSDGEDETIPQLVEPKRKVEAGAFESKNKKAKLKQESSDDDSDGDDEDDDNDDDDDPSAEVEVEEDDESGNDSDDESDSDESDTPQNLTPAKKNKQPNQKNTPSEKQQMNKSLNEKQQQKTPSTPGLVNGKFPKGQKSPKEAGNTPKTPKTPGSDSDATQKPIREGGVMVKDMKVGSGAVAKPGKKVAVYYTGRLKQNNKQFDSSTQGKGFVFKLGAAEVIKGWDVGVAGMKTGGKRLITIPAPMAYGTKGSPPVIPPNATLVFEVELRNVM